MRIRSYYIASGVGLAGLALLNDAPTIAVVVIASFVISWQIHALEVKVNFLLDQFGIIVRDDDVNK